MHSGHDFFSQLDLRRRALGMPATVLAKRSGIAFRTVQRILKGNHPQASFTNVQAVARALGMGIEVRSLVTAEDLREEQARTQAVRLMHHLQGTSALEAQALDSEQYEQMRRRYVHELLAGPTRKLWAE